ncbi:hypothetical protein DERF_010469 [Dermatophagoides farinae]|uniref:Uncharacterized protein n=1 Tax=Dermatophagoides farinae TaxID=6954 RepID=A0A922HVZ3_DERFA|nr:hypothetical protein DERF_010469 [Dermatophagoides farinae]
MSTIGRNCYIYSSKNIINIVSLYTWNISFSSSSSSYDFTSLSYIDKIVKCKEFTHPVLEG